MKKWMIYGAYGYTGWLIAEKAKQRGFTPVLAGRDKARCEDLARDLQLEWRSFPCDDPIEIARNLKGINTVLHCAGPFSATSAPMLEACLESKTNYLDITGEIPVFEHIHSQHERIFAAGIAAIPGVGFDVVPSDCLAAMLKEKSPEAKHLSLAFKSSGKVSPGTTKTMIEGMAQEGAIRENGKIKSVRAAYDVRKIRFSKRPQPAVTIPWGDVSTAFYSTGIPNIRVYIAASPSMIRSMKVSSFFKPVLSLPSVQRGLKRMAAKFVSGPSETERATLHCILWGEAKSEDGNLSEIRIKVPEAYALTVETALAATEKVLNGEVGPGAWTPSKAFGSSFILGIKGVEVLT